MARLRFKRFSDLAFLQSINKPRYLVPLLAPFTEYFTRQGLDLSQLANDDATDRKLLEFFTKPDEDMPGDLLELLYVLDDLADDSGHDRILNEVVQCGESLDGLSGELTCGEYAIAVYQAKPGLIQACYEKTVHRKIKNYAEFQSASGARLTLAAARHGKAALEQALAAWFDGRNRGMVCEMYPYQEGSEIRFIVTHGQTYRSEGSIDKNLRKSRVAYRPQKHDSIIYDTQTGILKLNAQSLPEKEEYRKQFGRVYFNDPDHFPSGDIYTLTPMQAASFELSLPHGIASAQLCEVWIQITDDRNVLQITKGYDLLRSAKSRAFPNLAVGEIVRAAFRVKYSGGGKARRLDVRPSNIAIYDHDRDGAAAEAFLRANRFMKMGPDSVVADASDEILSDARN
ncbi:MAG: hypothetical protein Q8R91_04375 [Candidatus Omnitrophota bacterium]|nr:hypothetical protein [Candidatus Omnitrophota bacterium]